MNYVFRTLEVPAEYVEVVRELARNIAGASGENMWTVPLSTTGNNPPTWFESTGLISDEFAQLLPLKNWSQDENGNWVSEVVSQGNAELIVYLAAQAGITISLSEVHSLLNVCDISIQEWPIVRARLGLQAVVENTGGGM